MTPMNDALGARIDALTRQLAELKERLQDAESNTSGPLNERPPHY